MGGGPILCSGPGPFLQRDSIRTCRMRSSVCVHVAICRSHVHHTVCLRAHCNSVKIVNIDCTLLNFNCSSPDQEPVT